MRETLQRCAKLEHAVAVVFERRLFSTKDCMRPCTESSGMQMTDVPYIYTFIHIPYIARIAVPFMWGSLRLAPITSSITLINWSCFLIYG